MRRYTVSHALVSLLVLAGLGALPPLQAQTPEAPARSWKATRTVRAPEAGQAAAASEDALFAITNRVVAKYDRHTGQRIALSEGEAHHLNSGFFWNGVLYCAHSNFPKKPDQSEIKVLDPKTMQLTTFKDFGVSEGSLTWVLRNEDSWWCCFAYYGKDNRRTYLVRFDDQWREQGRWRFPEQVLGRLGRMSVSGGIWWKGTLLTTGHDERELYRLRVPEKGDVLEYLETMPAPFPGQGIAVDPVTGGLVGLGPRRGAIVFAELSTETTDR
jgi:hypothetical protein